LSRDATPAARQAAELATGKIKPFTRPIQDDRYIGY
jgi:hypothetical protein